MEIGPHEVRVLGSLVEKQRTTPDAYPLTLNALRQACNQSTNREPVLELDDAAIRSALERLARKRWARLASGQGSRAPKYRHLLAETLGLDAAELSVLGVLMLRGAQTPGELKARAGRLHAFAELGEVEATLARLIERGHARRLERRPGQKEERFVQLLGDDAASSPAGVGEPAERWEGEAAAPREGRAGDEARPGPPAPMPETPVDSAALEARLSRLEAQVASLEEGLEQLRRELGN
jgi:uncharacterized protein